MNRVPQLGPPLLPFVGRAVSNFPLVPPLRGCQDLSQIGFLQVNVKPINTYSGRLPSAWGITFLLVPAIVQPLKGSICTCFADGLQLSIRSFARAPINVFFCPAELLTSMDLVSLFHLVRDFNCQFCLLLSLKLQGL